MVSALGRRLAEVLHDTSVCPFLLLPEDHGLFSFHPNEPT